MEAHLFFLPHEEGGGEGFHGHDGMDLHPNPFPAFLGRCSRHQFYLVFRNRLFSMRLRSS
jgi:hypothetical protein